MSINIIIPPLHALPALPAPFPFGYNPCMDRTMRKPVVGITTFVERKARGSYASLADDYIDSVAAAGATPVALPIARSAADRAAYLDLVDGLLLSGGADVHPRRYGEQPSRKISSWSTARDEFEIALTREALDRGIPVLGICRGHQVANVALGGSLYQDIYEQVPLVAGHNPDVEACDEPYHAIEFAPGPSRLRSAFEGADSEGRILVNSFHHQAVKDLAPGLRATALSADGIVEAFESGAEGTFLLCVQFHPECMTRRFPAFLGLFRALAQAAAARVRQNP
ncbi:MAG: gamma-glutamyl-gamma-aminobutyrate hydrolase family protein [Spirochaetaceae bacterium]|nr:gamma-glutamyl-gamma-aminobutyrate hydrolase family protein [Spirochaetaceae bacterium]